MFWVSTFWTVAMAEPPQLFKLVRRLFGAVGIYPSQSHRSTMTPFNVQILLILTFSLGMFMASFAFLILKVENVQDFGASFYAAITEFSTALGFLALVFQMQHIFEIMDEMERIIGNSKFINWIITWRNGPLPTKRRFPLFEYPIVNNKWYWFTNRNEWSNFENNVQQCEWQNWTNIEFSVFCTRQIERDRVQFTTDDYNNSQLFHPRFGRWIILFDVTRYVSQMRR